ncbi:MAG: double-strand break repair protein AddB [Roseobacter sp.]
MFETGSTPRVFGVAPGVDFPQALVDGLRKKVQNKPPEALARVDVIVNTTRMKRRMTQIFNDGPPLLLPRIHLVTELEGLAPDLILPPAISGLKRRLDLITLVSKLLETDPSLAPRSSLYDLTDSLAALMDEMQAEGVPPETIRQLDVSDQSGHWARAQRFISIAQSYLDENGAGADPQGRQRQVVNSLISRWETVPPMHPIIVAGSTGSRGTTHNLMQAAAQLPQGAVILPGFDFDQPQAVWQTLEDPLTSEDHPQFRFSKLLKNLALPVAQVAPWVETTAPSPARNKLISMSLRPAPVTDAWITEGKTLTDLDQAVENVTLLEAATPRLEALAIALRLRKAAEDGQIAALITPDRSLTRQVSAALDQWDILPDDSAGSPLHLSPPGRFLRHIAGLFQRTLDAETLLTLLKHPLCHANEDRAQHVLNTQRLEAQIRSKGLPYPQADSLRQLMEKYDAPEFKDWVEWVCGVLTGKQVAATLPLREWVTRHRQLAEALSAGRGGTEPGEIWDQKAGQKARAVFDDLDLHSDAGGTMTSAEYGDLIGALLAEGDVRDRDAPYSGIMIWGTLEARVQGADLVILAGLNEGSWPEAPAADPWLNRILRHKAGLLLPERRIGLSAHDYQQAIAAPEVWLSRSIRSDEAETVVARWVNRLLNLLNGLPEADGPACVAQMRNRGDDWLTLARSFEAVDRIPAAPRPSPVPPVSARPRKLSVTEIQRLIRDPYAIYARHVLGLKKTGPLVQTADALLRGTLSHDILEAFVRSYLRDPSTMTPLHFKQIAHVFLDRDVPWPSARALLRARFDRLAAWYVEADAARLQEATPIALEKEAAGSLDIENLGMTLTARADRFDATPSGTIILYDYKSGKPPTKNEQVTFNKQLLIEAAMVEQGAFRELGPRTVEKAQYIGLKTASDVVDAPLSDEPPAKVLAHLEELLAAYLDPNKGYTARLALQMDKYGGDYDLLSRYGEWDATAKPVRENLE